MARIAGGEIVSGRLGGRVYRNVGGEGFVSAAPAVVNPRTQPQNDARARLQLTNRLWAALPLAAMERWRIYAQTPAPFPSPKGRKRSTRGDLAFKGLTAKYLQVHGGASAPTEPPASSFLGDGVSVSVSVDDPTPAPPQGEGIRTLSRTKEAGTVGIAFTADFPNTPGVLTELLTQPLAARWRKPHPEEYRTRRFMAFETGELAATVACPPGAYACAVRFVRAATGQASALVPLGVVEAL